MTLRTTLIVVGVAIVVLVYLATAMKRRRESRASYHRGFSRVDVPDVILQHDEDAETEGGDSAPYAPRLPDEVVLPADPQTLDDLPAVRNDSRDVGADDAPRPRTDQMDLFSAGARAAPAAAASAAPAPETRTPSGAGDGLVTLYVRARAEQEISGTDLVKSLNGVGMKFGDMGIFHHYGAGDLQCETPVFSAANMFEPGTFDLARIEAFRTAGIALFMQLPGPLDGPVAFELLLGTAQRLAELTGARLYSDPRTLLDAQGIARLRSRAGRYGNVGG